jgi:hypothetical protein
MARSIVAKLAALGLAMGALGALIVARGRIVETTAPMDGGDVDGWHGYRRHVLLVSGRRAFVVAPREPAPGRPWIWRATFWGFSPEVDVALLAEGFHVGFVDTEDMYGSPRALAAWDDFYGTVTRDFGLSKKPVLEAISRGGLYAYRWAEAHPAQVSAILGDAPVCDFKSWPAGRIGGTRSEQDWIALQKAYAFANEDEALRFPDNPVDRLAALADARVLLVTVYGEADETVPPAENTLRVATRYRALGGRIELFPKPGVGHVHGIANATPIVRLLRDAAGAEGEPRSAATR